MRTLAFAALGTVLLLPGCSSDSDRFGVQGTVTVDGEPLEEGEIEFEPAEPGLRMAVAQIENGQYQVAPEFGVSPGKYKVRIKGYRMRTIPGLKPPSYLENGGDTVEQPEQYLPAKYNTQSTLTAVIDAAGENTHDFQLSDSP